MNDLLSGCYVVGGDGWVAPIVCEVLGPSRLMTSKNRRFKSCHPDHLTKP